MMPQVSTGNINNNATRIKSDARKGITPRKVSLIGTPSANLLITNTFMPTGGVIMPTSTTIKQMMPNYKAGCLSVIPKSKPITAGKKIGTVNRIIDNESIRQPKTRYTSKITIKIIIGEVSIPMIQSARP